jgi:hypothetical protein
MSGLNAMPRTSRSALLVALVVTGLGQAGCVTNTVEMPRGHAAAASAASAAKATQKGSVAFASARCFLYRRDNARPPSLWWALRAESDRAGRDTSGPRCGRPVGAGPPPVLARTLIFGETFGFHRDTAGRIFAIAGEERIPLEEGRYAWELTPLEYTQAQKTTGFIIGLIAAGFSGPII